MQVSSERHTLLATARLHCGSLDWLTHETNKQLRKFDSVASDEGGLERGKIQGRRGRECIEWVWLLTLTEMVWKGRAAVMEN